jgi:translation initiation factor IF-2
MVLGRAQVRQLFPITKVGTIYGSSVTEGKMVRGARARIKRGETLLGDRSDRFSR